MTAGTGEYPQLYQRPSFDTIIPDDPDFEFGSRPLAQKEPLEDSMVTYFARGSLCTLHFVV
jgi:hypothetical protein